MKTRRLTFVIAAAAALLAAPPLPAADPPKASAAVHEVPALTPEQTVKLNKLKLLSQPTASLSLVPGVAKLSMKPMKPKKEISCGIYLFPPNPNPAAWSPKLYFVNTTGQMIPPGAHIEWEVTGSPAACCKGEGDTTQGFPPNPPTAGFLQTGPVLNPPQPWTRECKAWVTLP